MTDRTAVDTAAIDHLITQLGRMIADATRVAESQEAAAEGSFGTSRSARYYESAEVNRALASVTLELTELAKVALTGTGKEWGVRAVNRATGRTEDIPQPSEASARQRVNRGSSTSVLICRIASDWYEAEPAAHSCDNCSGIDPDTCLFNGEKEES